MYLDLDVESQSLYAFLVKIRNCHTHGEVLWRKPCPKNIQGRNLNLTKNEKSAMEIK